MTKRPGKKNAETAEQTRQGILDAAMNHFAENGFKGASLREIASEADSTHGLIRHHFGTKEDLWRAVVNDFIGRIEERHRPLLDSLAESEPVESLKGFVRNFIRVSAESPNVAKIIMNDCSQPGPHLDYVVARLMPIHKAIEPVFLTVQTEGYFEHHDPDSFYIFLVMLGAFPFSLASFTNKFYSRDIRTRKGIEKHIELVIATLFEN